MTFGLPGLAEFPNFVFSIRPSIASCTNVTPEFCTVMVPVSRIPETTWPSRDVVKLLTVTRPLRRAACHSPVFVENGQTVIRGGTAAEPGSQPYQPSVGDPVGCPVGAGV